jgi:hypothetical protein
MYVVVVVRTTTVMYPEVIAFNNAASSVKKSRFGKVDRVNRGLLMAETQALRLSMACSCVGSAFAIEGFVMEIVCNPAVNIKIPSTNAKYRLVERAKFFIN